MYLESGISLYCTVRDFDIYTLYLNKLRFVLFFYNIYFEISVIYTIFVFHKSQSMIFKRKIYDELLRWKRTDEGRTAVLIQGARRVGKSTVAEEFATNEYDTHILVDFAACSTEIRELFNDVSDLNRIFMRLQLQYGIELK